MTALASIPPLERPERLFSVEEYLRMVQVGILTERDKVELLEGRIVEKMSRNPPHDSALHRLMNLLVRSVPTKNLVRAQSAIRLATSVPEPDLAVVRGPASRYDQSHPAAEDCLLVVEVSDSTLLDDRETKTALYARAGIPVYWIINLIDRRVELYSEPTGPDNFPAYRQRKDIPINGTLSLPIPGLKKTALRVADILPAK